MPRVTKEKRKKDEEKVIKLLLTQANESIDTIAKKCGLSRQTVWRIIKRLEENNVIWGYHAVVDKERLSMKTYLMLIKASAFPGKNTVDKIIKREAEKFSEKLGVMIAGSRYLHGQYDWVICFNARDTKQAKKFTHLVSKAYAEDVVDVVLLEEIFPIKKCGFSNPNIEKLREFELAP